MAHSILIPSLPTVSLFRAQIISSAKIVQNSICQNTMMLNILSPTAPMWPNVPFVLYGFNAPSHELYIGALMCSPALSPQSNAIMARLDRLIGRDVRCCHHAGDFARVLLAHQRWIGEAASQQ